MNTVKKLYPLNLTFHPQVESVVTQLNQAGAEAYVTGGALRDALLGKTVVDVDIATSMRYETLESFFPKASVMVALPKYFCVKLRFPELSIDVTSYRSEGEYADHRRPSTVYPATQQEDARRRDFTMNALYYDPKTHQVVDYFGGMRDLLQAGQVKLIHGKASLEEDYLRILRCLRFSLQCGLSIESHTLENVRQTVQHILSVDADRLRQELQKCLDAASLYAVLKLFDDVGLLSLFQVRPLAGSRVYPLWQALEGLVPGEGQLKDFLLAMIVLSEHEDFDGALKPWTTCLNIAQKDIAHVRKAYIKLKHPNQPMSNFHPPVIYDRWRSYTQLIQPTKV